MSKDSYYRKHKEKIHGADQQAREKTKAIIITEAQRAEFQEGKVLFIDKPLHWTSFDVVRKIRNSIGIKKVGHAGTLDPLATGLLIVCTGKYTKKINEYMLQEKEYTGNFTLGAVTPTYDLESEPTDIKSTAGITDEDIISKTKMFTGHIQQLPPVYSAIKQKGTSLYTLARRGEEIDLQPRPVHISVFEILSVNLPVVNFRIVCGTGTYIRSIANDFGASLGCGGYLSELRRTRIGENTVDNAVTVDEFILQLDVRE